MNQKEDLCLVTGACGFVGSHLVDTLISQGFSVRATDLKTADCRYFPKSNRLEFVPADLRHPTEVNLITKDVTKVFHPAGIFRFDIGRDKLNEVNIGGSTNLFTALLSQDISHVINWSSAMIYGTLEYTPADENHPIRPEEPYSQSKWIQEQIGLSYFEENGLPVYTLRPTAIYGPRSFYGTTRAFLALINNQILGIPGNGKAIQHHVHVSDVVNGAVFIMKELKHAGGVFNIADDVPLSVEESFKIVCDAIDMKIPRFHFPKFLVSIYGLLDRSWNKMRGRSSLYEKAALALLFSDHIFDNSKLKKQGFSYSIPDLQTGIIRTIDWFKREGYI